MANLAVISMNAGYMTPKVDTRSDVEKYSSGCRILDNMLPLIYGPVERRPGTEYIATGKNTPEGVRLVPFIYSSTISYMMEFGDLYARFYYDGARVLDGVEIVEIVTPYLVADLPQVQYKQSADVMWLVHSSYPPYKLSRTTASSFSMAKIAFTKGPFLERNDIAEADDVTMTSDVTAADSIGTLTASVATFESGHIGALWKLTHKREDTVAKGSRTTVGVIDAAIDVKGSWTFSTHGNWGMTVEIQRNEDGTNWETFRTYTSVLTGGQGSRNVQKTDIEEVDGVQYRMYVSAVDTPAGTIEADFTVNNPILEGIVRIDNVTSSTEAVITVLSKVASTDATKRWAEGAWSGVRDYPTSFTFFEERAVYAGGRRVWFSKTGKFENFETGVKDADAFELDLPTANTIRWVAALDALIVGTSGDEWRIRSTSIDAALTPTNFDIRQQTARGCRDIQALEVNEAVLFVDFVGRKVRELTYSEERQKFMSPDLTALAEDITEGGITSLAHQRNPDSIVWCTVDGDLLSMTYEREQNVVAWAKHPFGREIVDSTTIDTTTSEPVHYPILRELTAAEIPDKPDEPDDTGLLDETAITNYDELQAITGAGHYSISNDIDLAGETWTPIADFSGVLEGNGYTISNLSLSAAATDNQAIFSSILSGCEIRNLNFRDCSVTGKEGTAILVGWCLTQSGIKLSDISFTDCTVSCTSLGGSSAGCLFGGRKAGDEAEASDFHVWRCSTNNCTVNADILGGYAGSLIGAIWAVGGTINIVDCYVNGGTVVAPVAGGFAYDLAGVGSGNTVIVHSCYSTASLTESGQTSTTAAGFVSSFHGGSIISSYSTGTLTNATSGSTIRSAGGFLGYIISGTEPTNIINCYSTSSITTTTFGPSVGGFMGYIQTVGVGDVTIKRCYSTGSMSSTENAGGKAGIAGFVGYLNLAPATATNSPVTIERCWTTSDISISDDVKYYSKIGGFVGRVDIDFQTDDPDTDYIIRNCYAWGSLLLGNETNYAGGFIGYEEDDGTAGYSGLQLINCYSAQTNSKYGSSLINQIVGEDLEFTKSFLGFNETGDNWPVTECFWDNVTTETDDEPPPSFPDIRTPLAAAGHTTEWMMTESNYEDADWDLDAIWDMDRNIVYVQREASGTVESVAVIPGEDEDEVWVAVLRDIDGTETRFIERMKPRNFGELEDAFFVDCGLSYNGDATDTFTNLGHLEGETVSILGDGAVYANEVVADGSVTINNEVEKAHIGLPSEYRVKPMRLDVTTQTGTTHGSIKKISELVVSFLDTLNAQYGDGTDTYNIDWRTTEEYDSPPELFTGDKTVVFDGGFDVDDPILISGSDPTPCTVRAIVARIDKTGR